MYEILMSRMNATCLPHLILPDWLIIMFCKHQGNFSLCNQFITLLLWLRSKCCYQNPVIKQLPLHSSHNMTTTVFISKSVLR
jgi:hypothetical protein